MEASNQRRRDSDTPGFTVGELIREHDQRISAVERAQQQAALENVQQTERLSAVKSEVTLLRETIKDIGNDVAKLPWKILSGTGLMIAIAVPVITELIK